MDKETRDIALQAQHTAEETKLVVKSLKRTIDDRADREKEDRLDAKHEREALRNQLADHNNFVSKTLVPVIGDLSDMMESMTAFLDKHSGPPQQDSFNWKWAALAMAGLAAMLLKPILDKT